MRGPARLPRLDDPVEERRVFVSHPLGREEVGLKEGGDGIWSLFFGPVHLGWLDRIMHVRGRTRMRQ
jgi:hypothetical protein